MRSLLSLFSSLPNHRLASATFYGSLVRLSAMAMAFLTGLILARVLGKSGFGIYGIVISAGGIAASAALLGAPYLAVREIAQGTGSNDWSKVFGVMKHLTVPVAVIALAAAALVTTVLILSARADPMMIAAAWWVPAFVISYALAVLMSSYLRGLDHPVQAQSVEVLFRPMLLLPPILLPMVAGWPLDAAAAVALTAAATFVSLIIGLYWVRTATAAYRPFHNPDRQDGLVRKAIPFAVIDVLRQLEGAYPLLILGIVAANDVAGSFRVGQLGAMLVAVPYTVISHVMSPSMAKAGQEPIGDGLLRNSARAMFGISLVGLAAAVLIGDPAISLLFGQEYRDAWLPLVILCAVQCVNGFFGVGPVLLILAGEERQVLHTYAVTVPVAIVLAWFLALEYGASGAAAAVLLGSLLSNALLWRHATAKLGVDPSLMGR